MSVGEGMDGLIEQGQMLHDSQSNKESKYWLESHLSRSNTFILRFFLTNSPLNPLASQNTAAIHKKMVIDAGICSPDV